MRSDSILPVLTRAKVTAALLPLLLPIPGDCQTWIASRRPDLARFCTVDLQAQANQKRVDDFPTKKNLPGNNLAALAAGKHDALGIAFQVGEGVLHLGNTKLKGLPEKLEIKIGKKFNTLHILHAAAYAVDEGKVTIATAGGAADGSLGTSMDKVLEALHRADSPDGILVLLDLGSAVMTTEMAVETFNAEQSHRVVISPAPLVEGAVIAAVEASIGNSLDEVAAAAANAHLMPKLSDQHS